MAYKRRGGGGPRELSSTKGASRRAQGLKRGAGGVERRRQRKEGWRKG